MAFSKRQHFFAVLTIVGIFFVALPFAALAAGNQVISVSKDQIIDGNFIRAGSSIETLSSIPILPSALILTFGVLDPVANVMSPALYVTKAKLLLSKLSPDFIDKGP